VKIVEWSGELKLLRTCWHWWGMHYYWKNVKLNYTKQIFIHFI